jgi:hypothetical protein
MRKVEASITIHQPASKIFDAFFTPNQLKKWWGVERCLIDQKQGGIYSLAWNVSNQGFQYISTGILTVFHPGNKFLVDHFVYFNPERAILGPTHLSVKLQEKDSFTFLQLIQGGYQDGDDWNWFYEAVKQAWPKVLEDLKKFMEQ